MFAAVAVDIRVAHYVRGVQIDAQQKHEPLDSADQRRLLSMGVELGAGELILGLLIVLLVLGARRLPQIVSSLEEGIREFQRSIRGI